MASSVTSADEKMADAYWSRISAAWHLIGPPLRPSSEDITVMEHIVGTWQCDSSGRPARAGILGVTPEIVAMRWPQLSSLTAFDKEPAMIRNIWPTGLIPHAAAVCCNWISLPTADAGLDIVVGDGSLSQLSFPDECRKVSRELARVISAGGLLVLRLFVPPPEHETVDSVFEELWNGRIDNFNAFKWRLLMSLQEIPEKGVCVGDAWEVWHSRISSPERLAGTLGWSVESVRVIDRYCGESAVYSFPPLESITGLLEPDFYLSELVVPSYQDGNRYPTVCFTRR